MGAPNPEMTAADVASAESLLGALKTIAGPEKQKHAAVLDYWLSIRGDREFPPLHDLDPLEISDAGPSSLLLELIGGGEDAEIRHLGAGLKDFVEGDRIATATRPSILASIAKKLSIVAISRNFLAFEDEFTLGSETTRCWVTLYPLSAAGAWVDYVYALVSVETKPAEEAAEVSDDPTNSEVSELVQHEDVPALSQAEADDELPPVEIEQEELTDAFEASEDEFEPVERAVQHKNTPDAVAGTSKVGPGFTKLLESLAGLGGFYATHAAEAEVNFSSAPAVEDEHDDLTSTVESGSNQPVEQTDAAESIEEFAAVPSEPQQPEPQEQIAPAEEFEEAAISEEPEEAAPFIELEPVAVAEKQVTTSTVALEGSLQSKLADVRTKADEARLAKLRANAALYEGLSAAYDFALDAEEAPEEYLQIVQAQGLKIQLRSPMKPVVKLAFDGLCDDSTIGQLEAVLAWAIKQELPRGTLAERLEAEGGIAQVLNGEAKAAA
jgi:hypothetical protein